MTTHSDVDSYLNDADDYEAGIAEALIEQHENSGKRGRAAAKPRSSWRNVENYLEDRKLRQALKEYYDDF
ncbi:MAG TPA: hypothetical protein VFL45_10715 [Gammaproteobacteria bacterium]|jgi:hypothetical protein|nr:hypothetical protein [Gammaproteobacteria bacterium]